MEAVKLSRKQYREEYLASDEWKTLRQSVIDLKPDCVLCGAQARDLHHVIYRKDIYSAQIGDLLPVCRSCHNLAHRGIKLKLIKSPSRAHPNELKKVITQTLSITKEQCKAAQSHNQTKRLLTSEEVRDIRHSGHTIKRLIYGVLKSAEYAFDKIKHTNARIDKAKAILSATDTKPKELAFLKRNGFKREARQLSARLSKQGKR